MSLLEQSEAIAAEMSTVAAARALAEQTQAVKTRAAAFGEVAGIIAVAHARAHALKARGIEFSARAPGAADVRRNLAKWRQAKEANAAAVISAGPQTVQTQILQPTKRLAATLETASREAWQRHARSRLPKVDEETLKLLGGLPGLSQAVEAFRHEYSRALASADTVPSTDAEFDHFDHYARRCEESWRNLDAAELPDAVLRFLREAATPAGAALTAFNDEVKGWLERQGWTAKFRIRSR